MGLSIINIYKPSFLGYPHLWKPPYGGFHSHGCTPGCTGWLISWETQPSFDFGMISGGTPHLMETSISMNSRTWDAEEICSAGFLTPVDFLILRWSTALVAITKGTLHHRPLRTVSESWLLERLKNPTKGSWVFFGSLRVWQGFTYQKGRFGTLLADVLMRNIYVFLGLGQNSSVSPVRTWLWGKRWDPKDLQIDWRFPHLFDGNSITL